MWIPLQHFDSIARLLHVTPDPHDTLIYIAGSLWV